MDKLRAEQEYFKRIIDQIQHLAHEKKIIGETNTVHIYGKDNGMRFNNDMEVVKGCQEVANNYYDLRIKGRMEELDKSYARIKEIVQEIYGHNS